MSGGFFRGTSADQDTRFSNKMSKLLKSQKFAPELDVLVEMAKVKIDVIKPWIATRVTELLGFEDEVLINFIYGLLDVKEADGKHLQIQLTGFMEKNTGRFMKELWGLLTSAQNNDSGVPQQFLDAKAEEAKKKKEEKDRILSEVLRRKEEQEKDAEEERQRRLSAKEESSKADFEKRSASGSPLKISDDTPADGLQDPGGRSGRDKRKISASPERSGSLSSRPSRGSPPSRQRYPRSMSRSPVRRRQSGSPYRGRSPVRRHSPFPSHYPLHRRRSPIASRTPPRRRTPPRKSRRPPASFYSPPRRYVGPRSPPLRRRSPSRSVSPYRARRSPSRSPNLRWRRSPSKDYGVLRSRSPVRRRRSPGRAQVVRQSRSSPRRRESSSKERVVRQSRGRPRRSRSPHDGQTSLSREEVVRQSRSPPRRQSSLAREVVVQRSRSPPYQRRRSHSREQVRQRIRSPYRNRRSLSRERGGRRNGFDARDQDRSEREDEQLEWTSTLQRRSKKEVLLDLHPLPSGERNRLALKEEREMRSTQTRLSGDKRPYHHFEERSDSETVKYNQNDGRDADGRQGTQKNLSRYEELSDDENVRIDAAKGMPDRKDKLNKVAVESTSKDVHAPRPEAGLNKDGMNEVVDDEDSDSPRSSEERHVSKRRRKEEKRRRKEEKQKRREERSRRREERRMAKSAKGAENDGEDCKSRPKPENDHHGPREVLGKAEVVRSKREETEAEQKQIEEELRKKALESLRAKKGIAY